MGQDGGGGEQGLQTSECCLDVFRPLEKLESGCQIGRRGYHFAVILEEVCKVKEKLKLLLGGRRRRRQEFSLLNDEAQTSD